MDPFVSLMLLCAAMFGGSMGAGLVPIKCALSETRIRVLTIFGAGLLVGTALVVIIPEGVHMWYEAEAKAAAEAAAQAAALATSTAAAAVSSSTIGPGSSLHAAAIGVAARHLATGVSSAMAATQVAAAAAQAMQPAAPPRRLGALRGVHSDSADEHDHDHDHDHDHSHGEGSGHRVIGASLACGFAFMLVVDTMGGSHGHGHSHGGSRTRSGSDHTDHSHGHDHSHGAAGDEGAGAGAGAVADAEGAGEGVDDRSRSAAMGLLVHAAVDGIALGAAAASQQSSVEMLVFVAIMLHKAPAAFGLASYLIHNGVPLEGVKNQLIKFSSAAPATALVTFYFLRLGIVGASLRMLAVCFMFSGGTFLFVSAAHILPEIQASQDADTTPAHRRTRFANMWVMVCGIMLPLLINIEHGH